MRSPKNNLEKALLARKIRQAVIYSVSKKNPPGVFWHFPQTVGIF